MNQDSLSAARFLDRGPSWDTGYIPDPVWVTRGILKPRAEEEEHVLSRYQFNIHLGDPLAVEFYLDGKKRSGVLHFGDLNWTPAGDSCRGTWQQPREMGFVTFSKTFLSQTADEMGFQRLPLHSSFRHNEPLARELVLALLRTEPTDRVYTESLGSALAVHLLRTANPEKSRNLSPSGKLGQQQLQRALDYVESRLGEEVDLTSWAREAGLSPYHFARLFKQTTGSTPHQYLLHRRVERAKTLLAEPQTTISAVSYDLGFASQSHFQRVFRQHTQMTPGEWRSLGASGASSLER